MKKIIKRLSNRQYAPEKCRQCGKDFIPSDARQKYCCEQHRIDFHNDQRKIKDQPFKKMNARILNNEAILEKMFSKYGGLPKMHIPKWLLAYEGYDFQINHERGINPGTDNEIEWFLYYGLEVADKEKQTFIVHKRNFSL